MPFLTLGLNKTFDTLLFCSPLKARQIFHYRKNKKQKHMYQKKEVYVFDPCLTFEIFTLQQEASLSFLLRLFGSSVALFFLGSSACPFGLPFSRGYCPSLTQLIANTYLCTQAPAQLANKELLFIKGHLPGNHFFNKHISQCPISLPSHLISWYSSHPCFIDEKNVCSKETCLILDTREVTELSLSPVQSDSIASGLINEQD